MIHPHKHSHEALLKPPQLQADYWSWCWFGSKITHQASSLMRLCRMSAVVEQWEAPFVLAQRVSASISSICQLLRISLPRQGCFAACCNLDEQLSRHTFFFIKINDNSVVYLQLQLLTDAAGCQWLSARGREWNLWLSAVQINLNQNFKILFG